MLTPKYLANAPNNITVLFDELEESIIRDISRRVAKTGKLTNTAAWQLYRLQEMGIGFDSIESKIARTLKRSQKEVEKLITDATLDSLRSDDEVYEAAGFNPAPPEESQYIRDYIAAIVRQTQGELKNFTRSMGFKTATGFSPLAQYYQHALDLAHMKVMSGAFDYQTAIRQAVKELADSGIYCVDYMSGRTNHADVAVRRAVLTGIHKTTGELAVMRADEFGVTTMEITAHAGARPDHATWQGQIVDRSGRDKRFLTLDDIGYGTGAGFKGWNCRHDWAPFIPDISVRTYTDKQLKNLDPPPVEIGGKTYSYYDATRKQRRMETAIRKTKRELIATDGAGLKDDFTAASIKLRRQREAYKEFCRVAGLRAKNERAGVFGYGHSISGKAVWAAKRFTKEGH